MVTTTRTLNPLPFHDLEPKRFEDLVRQLLYDFRPWRLLEATGRGGADDGFDARGYERAGDQSAVDPEGDLPSGDDDEGAAPDRLWLIQCKRERAITPSKMAKHLADIPDTEAGTLYGIVFAIACDVSKATRDVLRQWAARNGIAEAHIWAKSELEDAVFQPKNDHILFAYFGISLQIRRRSARTAIRARLATKKRCEKVLSEGRTVLLRDSEDDSYPDQDADKVGKQNWRVTEILEMHPRGLILLASRHFAYLADDGVRWDCLDGFNDGTKSRHEDPWITQKDEAKTAEDRATIISVWSLLPLENRAMATRVILVPYDSILAIDDTGDMWASYPHIYLDELGGKLGGLVIEGVQGYPPSKLYAERAQRISAFPPELQKWRVAPPPAQTARKNK
ncbi:hypothetical protein [Muricoccus aerilatus]|uniref:hypothetical protein n=1 Tax=Muricoccus aerilatus TaxID=452982 RepID=UPI0012EC13AE|nr:hypothetical protein [Roseomonas aerilata]